MNIASKAASRGSTAVFPSLPEMRVRLRNGVVEFPLHHVRGGTSTGLVIWDRFAPGKLELKEELLQYMYYYNHERPHQAINGKKPVEMLGADEQGTKDE